DVMDPSRAPSLEARQRRRRGGRDRARCQSRRQADLARHEAGRARSVGDDRAALQAGRADARTREEPHRLRRVHRARARGRWAPAHLGHVLDPQCGSPLGDPQEGPGDRDADPQSRSRQQADLARAQADPARPVDHGSAALGVAAKHGAASTVTTTTTTTRNRPVRRRTVVLAALAIYLGVAFLFVAALSMAVAPAGGGGAVFGARVAIVELEGTIVDVDDLLRELKAHRDNPQVKAVVL